LETTFLSALTAADISKYFARTCAVDDLSFEVYEGEIFGMLGPNGAGKATTIWMALDIVKVVDHRYLPCPYTVGGSDAEARQVSEDNTRRQISVFRSEGLCYALGHERPARKA
jgi:ABC-type multidrug transport system ATPase subunit